MIPEPHAALELQRSLVLVLDLCGTFAFAVSGATAAVRRRLDIFGVLVVSFMGWTRQSAKVKSGRFSRIWKPVLPS